MKEGRYFLPYNAQLVEKAKEMRSHPTFAEQKLWQFFRSTPPFCRGGGLKVWRQKPIALFYSRFLLSKVKVSD